MSVLATHPAGNGLMDRLLDPKSTLFQALAVIVVGVVLGLVFDWARIWPAEWIVPIKVWISDLFTWLDKTATLGLFTVKQFTRTLSWMLKQPLLWSEYLLWKGARPHQLLPIMWIAIATLAGLIAYNLRGPKVAALVAAGIIGVVLVDSLPVILGSIAKNLRVQPFMAPEAFVGISQWPADLLKSTMSARKVRYVPWLAVVLGFGILGHWVGGWRLALTTVLCMGYLAVTGLWRESMKTFSLVVVAVPFSALLGLWLGVWVTRSKRAAKIITPVFDLMQATPV